MSKKLSVMWLGLRGFPEVQGGIEKHAEYICPLLVELGCDVHVLTRTAYQPEELKTWHGVQFHSLWSPPSRSLETIVHTFLGVLYAGFIKRPDILHIQAIGPAFWTPLARLLGLKVVITSHGSDYERQCWGFLAKSVLKIGECVGMRCSNARIVISKGIQKHNYSKHHAVCDLIHNGVTLPDIPDSTGHLEEFGLTPNKYIIWVSRLVPEKRHLDLIEAFRLAGLSDDWKLAIIGSSDHPDVYTEQVLDTIEKTPNVIATGFQNGLALRELYAHAHTFVLPSSHEGLSIALLEALGYGLTVVASDIPANLEIELPEEHYFPLGNVDVLAEKLRYFTQQKVTDEQRQARRDWVAQRYNWRDIAKKTLQVYQKALV